MIRTVIYPIKAEPVLPEELRPEQPPTPLTWFAAASEPVRLAAFSLAAILATGVFVGEPGDLPVVYDPAGLEWFQPAGEPTPPKAGLHASLQLASTIDADLLTQPETLHVDRWFVAAQEPVLPPAPINVAQSTIDPTTLLPRITVDRWFKQTEEPVRVVQHSLAALLPSTVFVGDPDDFVVFDPSGLQWFRPTDEPIRVTPKSLAALLSDGVFVGDPGGFFAYDPSELGWFQSAGEPVRTTPINPSALVGGTDGNVDILPTPPVVDALIKHRGFTQNVGKMVG